MNFNKKYKKIDKIDLSSALDTCVKRANLLSEMDAATAINHTNSLNVSYWEQILTGTITSLISITGIIGNLMLITAMLFSRKLHTMTNAFVTSLAVADLMTAFFLIWFAVGVFGPDGWPLPQAYWICDVTGFVIFASRMTALYTLGTIAVNRLISVTKPYLYKWIFKSWRLGILIAIPWVIPFGSVAGLVLNGVGTFGYDDTKKSCCIVSYHDKSDILTFCIVVIGFPLPLLVVLVSYIWIYIYLKKHFRKKKRVLHISSPYADGNSLDEANAFDTEAYERIDTANAPGAQADERIDAPLIEGQLHYGSTANRHLIERRKKISMDQIKITKNLLLIVCSIYICFLPYAVFLLKKNRHVIFYTRMITFSNCAINFAIHAFKHSEFKLVLGHILRRNYADIPQPSRFLKFLIKK